MLLKGVPWKDILSVGVSAFGGAWLAFKLESRREDKKEKDDQYRELRLAHFVVVSQYQELVVLRNNHVQQYEDRDDAWWSLHPISLGFTSPKLNVSKLAFLLEGPDPNLLNRLVVGEQQYEMVRNILTLRNQRHEEMQSRAAALQAQGNDTLENEEAWYRMVGKDRIVQLRDLTTGLFGILKDAIPLFEANIKRLSEFSSTYFPDRRTPRVEIGPQGEVR